jgi:hypothetical protein
MPAAVADHLIASSRADTSAAYVTDSLHPAVFGLLIGAYGSMLLALWLIFVSNVETLVALAVCTVYFAMFFGVPLAMYRVQSKAQPVRAAGGTLSEFLRGELETYGGRISGWGAAIQVLVVPAPITLGIVAIGLIFKAAAAGG